MKALSSSIPVTFCILLAACGSERLVEPEGAASSGNQKWHCRGSEAGGWYCSDNPGDPELLERQLEPVPPAAAEAVEEVIAAENEVASGDQANIGSAEDAPVEDAPVEDSDTADEPVMDTAPAPVVAADRDDDEPQAGDGIETVAPEAAASEGEQAAETTASAPSRLGQETDIFALPADYFVLQLMADRQEQEIVAALERLALPEATYGRILSNDEVWYVLIAGIYPDRASAQQAQSRLDLTNLPVEPWIRSLGSLQNAIRRFQDSQDQ